jgi:hypothetical protein
MVPHADGALFHLRERSRLTVHPLNTEPLK